MGVLHLFAHFLFHCPQLWWLRGARWSWLRPEEDVAAGLDCLILKIVLIEIISRFLSSVAPPHSAGNLAQSGLWQGQRFVRFHYIHHYCCCLSDINHCHCCCCLLYLIVFLASSDHSLLNKIISGNFSRALLVGRTDWGPGEHVPSAWAGGF